LYPNGLQLVTFLFKKLSKKTLLKTSKHFFHFFFFWGCSEKNITKVQTFGKK